MAKDFAARFRVEPGKRAHLGRRDAADLRAFPDRDAAEKQSAKDCVAILRSEAGRHPHDRELSDLIGELATRSDEFRQLWAAHNVHLHTKGTKQFNHPLVGELELSFNRLEVTADPGLMIVAYTAEPGSRSAEAFNLLASWTATEETDDLASGASTHDAKQHSD